MNELKLNNFNIKDIEINRDKHEYKLINDKSINFISVTTYIADFFDKFDALKVATRLVTKIPKYKHMTIDELLSQWTDARDHGTKVHNEIEDYLLDNKTPSEPKALLGIQWLNKHIDDNKHQLFSEKIIYSKELKIAGSVDLIIKNSQTNDYTIVDWKTNKKITTNSFKNKMGTHPITCDIEDCKYNLYALQLSLYRYLLEEYYGINIGRQLIVHLKNDKVVAYMTPYFDKHVKQFAELRRES